MVFSKDIEEFFKRLESSLNYRVFRDDKSKDDSFITFLSYNGTDDSQKVFNGLCLIRFDCFSFSKGLTFFSVLDNNYSCSGQDYGRGASNSCHYFFPFDSSKKQLENMLDTGSVEINQKCVSVENRSDYDIANGGPDIDIDFTNIQQGLAKGLLCINNKQLVSLVKFFPVGSVETLTGNQSNPSYEYEDINSRVKLILDAH